MPSPLFFPKDYFGTPVTTRIERVFTVNDFFGNSPSFDPMLSSYIGGYNPSNVPRTVLFNLRGIPPGNYDLYLYSGQKSGLGVGTDFYVQVNDGALAVKTIVPSSLVEFVEMDNYARFNLTSTSLNDVIHVTVVGVINGLQLVKTSDSQIEGPEGPVFGPDGPVFGP